MIPNKGLLLLDRMLVKLIPQKAGFASWSWTHDKFCHMKLAKARII